MPEHPDPAPPVPVGDVLDALDAIRGAVTLISPEDTLVIRVPWDTPPDVMTRYCSELDEQLTGMGWRNRFIVLPAEQLAVLADAGDL